MLYCGKCRKPIESYFPEGKTLFGRGRYPAECDCQRKIREERQAAEERRRHLDAVEELKRRGFPDQTMRGWTFENDNGQNPQTATARRYVEEWEREYYDRTKSRPRRPPPGLRDGNPHGEHRPCCVRLFQGEQHRNRRRQNGKSAES